LSTLGNVVEAAEQHLVVHAACQRGGGVLSEIERFLQVVQPLAHRVSRRFGALLRSGRVHGQHDGEDKNSADRR